MLDNSGFSSAGLSQATRDFFQGGVRDTTTKESAKIAQQTASLRTILRNPNVKSLDNKGKTVNVKSLKAAVLKGGKLSSVLHGNQDFSASSSCARTGEPFCSQSSKCGTLQERIARLDDMGATWEEGCRHDGHRWYLVGVPRVRTNILFQICTFPLPREGSRVVFVTTTPF